MSSLTRDKSIKKSAKILAILILIIAGLAILVWAGLRTPAIQTLVARQAIQYIAKTTGSKLSVDKVRYRLDKSLMLKNIYIADKQNDTLIFISKLTAEVEDFDFNTKSITINNININGLTSNITQIDSTAFNFDFIIDSLKPKNKKAFVWKIKCKSFNIGNSLVNISPLKSNPINIKRFNCLVENINYSSSELSLILSRFNFKANKKFNLKNLSFSLLMHDNLISLRALNLLTDQSHLNANKTKILIPPKANRAAFQFNTTIHSSRIIPADFGIFINSFKNFDKSIAITGKLKGDTKSIIGESISILADNETSANLDFLIGNINKPNELKYDLTVHELLSNKKSIESILKTLNDSIKILDEFKLLGDFYYTGILRGSTQKLFSKGTFSSQIGLIETNLLLTKKNNKTYIDGKLKTKPIFIDQFLSDSTDANLNLDLNAKGYFSSTEGYDINITGGLSKIVYNTFTLDSIGVIGNLKNKVYTGKISSYDPRLRFDFEGKIQLDSTYTYDFQSYIYTCDLHALGINTVKKSGDLSLNLKANFSGESLANATGSILATDLFYFQDSSYFATDTVKITSSENANDKSIIFTSEYVSAKINGQFQLKSIINDIRNFTQNYTPSLIDNHVQNDTNNIFDFEVAFDYPHPLTELLTPELRISPGTHFIGRYNSKKQKLNFHGESSKINFIKREISNVEINGYTKNSIFEIDLKAKDLEYTATNSLKNFSLKLGIFNDSIKTQLHWNNWLNKAYRGNIKSLIVLNNKYNAPIPNIKAEIFASKIIMNDSLWTINNCSIETDSSDITFENIHFKSGNSSFSINGKLSNNPLDSIDLELNNINLIYLNTLLKNSKVTFGGLISGNSHLKDLRGERKINFDLFIDQLTLNDSPIGQTHLISNWNKASKALNINGITTEKNDTTFTFNGYIIPSTKEINCNTHFNNYNLELLNAFLKPTLTEVTGRGSGDVLLTGTLPSPAWEGAIFANNAHLMLSPTKVFYSSSDTIKLTNHQLIFENQKVYDRDSNYAILNGIIEHQDFKDFSYNLKLNSDKILSIDTKYADNPLYHGTAYGKGMVEISGPATNLNIDIVATTLSNTKFFIPLEGKGDIKDNDFINFYDPYFETPEEKTDNKKQKDIIIEDQYHTNLKINLTVTPDAEVQIIFDPQIGDMLTATGNAELTMEALDDDFFMYGDYMIYKGVFVFTLQNMINKQLEIQQGSHVSWSGDPINADINIDAVYKVRRASLGDLTLNESDKEQKIPVNCHLLMTNKLLNPELKFKVEVPTTTNNESVEQINSLSEEEINKQVLSLLLVNKFMPLPGLVQSNNSNTTGNLTATTASELLSNQLSSWLSQMTTDFDMGISYRPKDDVSAQEYEFELSTTLWDDRVAVNGNFGYSNDPNAINATNSPYTTDVQVELKLNKKGNIRLNAFQKVNNDYIYNGNAAYTYGIGIFYTEDFDDFEELLSRMFNKSVATKPEELKLENEEL